MRARIRRFAYSPYAPRAIAEKITELLFLAGAALALWLCFGGPVFVAYCNVMLIVGRVAGTVPA